MSTQNYSLNIEPSSDSESPIFVLSSSISKNSTVYHLSQIQSHHYCYQMGDPPPAMFSVTGSFYCHKREPESSIL